MPGERDNGEGHGGKHELGGRFPVKTPATVGDLGIGDVVLTHAGLYKIMGRYDNIEAALVRSWATGMGTIGEPEWLPYPTQVKELVEHGQDRYRGKATGTGTFDPVAGGER